MKFMLSILFAIGVLTGTTSDAQAQYWYRGQEQPGPWVDFKVPKDIQDEMRSRGMDDAGIESAYSQCYKDTLAVYRGTNTNRYGEFARPSAEEFVKSMNERFRARFKTEAEEKARKAEEDRIKAQNAHNAQNARDIQTARQALTQELQDFLLRQCEDAKTLKNQICADPTFIEAVSRSATEKFERDLQPMIDEILKPLETRVRTLEDKVDGAKK